MNIGAVDENVKLQDSQPMSVLTEVVGQAFHLSAPSFLSTSKKSAEASNESGGASNESTVTSNESTGALNESTEASNDSTEAPAKRMDGSKNSICTGEGDIFSGLPSDDGLSAKTNGTLKVIISGLVSRFLFNSTLAQVVSTSSGQGFGVHVYLSLVGFGNGARWHPEGYIPPGNDPLLQGKTGIDLCRLLEQRIQDHNGSLVYFKYQTYHEEIKPLLPGYGGLMTQYNPDWSAIGRNVLRRWKSTEEMYRASSSLGDDEGYTLWCRDDAYWLYPFDLQYVLGTTHLATNNGSLIARNCGQWGGINDKCLLMGAHAAQAMLTAYSAVWTRGLNLASKNAEQVLLDLAQQRNTWLQQVPFNVLSCADSQLWHGQNTLVPEEYGICLKHNEARGCLGSYWPNGPIWCDNVGR
jgi:hypothetical protein